MYNIDMNTKQGKISFKYLHKTKDFLHEETSTLITQNDLNSGPYLNFKELIESTGNPCSKELLLGMRLFSKYQLSEDTTISMTYDLD
jgi:hypothetical protein